MKYIHYVNDEKLWVDFYIRESLTQKVTNEVKLTKIGDKKVIEICKSLLLCEVSQKYIMNMGINAPFSRGTNMILSPVGYGIRHYHFCDKHTRMIADMLGYHKTMGGISTHQPALKTILSDLLNLTGSQIEEIRIPTPTINQVYNVTRKGNNLFTGVYMTGHEYANAKDFLTELANSFFMAHDIIVTSRNKLRVKAFAFAVHLASALARIMYLHKRAESGHQHVFLPKGSYRIYSPKKLFASDDYIYRVFPAVSPSRLIKNPEVLSCTGVGSDITEMVIRNPVDVIVGIPRVPAEFFIPAFRSALKCIINFLMTFRDDHSIYANYSSRFHRYEDSGITQKLTQGIATSSSRQWP